MRLGIDFGYGYTGIGLLDDDNKVLQCRVIEHRQLSKTLAERRTLRAARRRNESRRRRLRDFYALLKGMDLEPVNARPGETMTDAERMMLGNRLYALAHHRGWDYAELEELLVERQDNKPPQQTETVKKLDAMLIEEYNAPKEDNAPNEEHKKTLKDKTKTYKNLKTPYLGELQSLEKEIYNAENGKKGAVLSEEKLAVLQDEQARIIECLTGDEKALEEWFKKRLKAVFNGELPAKADEIILQTKIYLGLENNDELFENSKAYRPSRNRHRDTMMKEMEELLGLVYDKDKNFSNLFETHFNKAKKKSLAKDTVHKQEEYKRQWQDAIKKVEAKAEANANVRTEKEKRPVSADDVEKSWVETAEKIIQRGYRKKRFENRKVGKCPAKVDGQRCNKNMPRKNKEEIRRLQFEIELRQMNFKVDRTKLSNDEIKGVMEKLLLNKKPTAKSGEQNRKTIADLRQTPKSKDDSARTKKEILHDIANGGQGGRSGLCAKHLSEKLQLLKEKNGKFEDSEWEASEDGCKWSARWQLLHEERILGLEDSPPSIRQKVQRVLSEIRQILKRHKCCADDIQHIGIETARFDISSLAQGEGKKSKKKAKQYQTSRRPADRKGLAEAQGDLCFLCGERLYGAIQIDHLFPKARGGGNVRLNLVTAHSSCNSAKGHGILNDGQISTDALANIHQTDPQKAAYIVKRLDNETTLPEDSMALPQHTMFGAKVLVGALQNEFNWTNEERKKIIHRPRARDIQFLSGEWFPLMSGQKRAIRAKSKEWIDMTVELGGTKNKEFKLQDKLDNYLFADGEISLEKKPDWLIDSGSGKDRTLSAPELSAPEMPLTVAVGIHKITVRCDNERVLLKAHAESLDGEECELKGKPVQAKIGEEVSINIKDIRPTGCEKANPKIKNGDGWLKIEKNKLFGTPQCAPGKKYIIWQVINFIDDKGEIIGTTTIKANNAYRILKVAVIPPKDAPINSFHHALDAVVIAAKVDWEKILRLHKEKNERSKSGQRTMQQQVEQGQPDFSTWQQAVMVKNSDGDFSAPTKRTFYFKDQAPSRSTQKKYETEPYRIRGEDVYQRVPLYEIEKKNIIHINSELIREAMTNAWEGIKTATEEQEKEWKKKDTKGEYLTQGYFLQLPPDHLLRPKKTRAALCKRGGKGIKGIGGKQIFEPLPDRHHGSRDKRKNQTHYFRREEAWAEAWVYEDEKGKLKTVRVKDKFYWRDKTQMTPQDTDIGVVPPEDKIKCRYKKRDKVSVEKKHGCWRISQLGNSATLLPDDEAADKVIAHKIARKKEKEAAKKVAKSEVAKSEKKKKNEENYITAAYAKLSHCE